MVPSNMAYVADITTHETRAKGMGYLGASMNLGMVLGPGLGGIIAGFGIRVPYFLRVDLGLSLRYFVFICQRHYQRKNGNPLTNGPLGNPFVVKS